MARLDPDGQEDRFRSQPTRQQFGLLTKARFGLSTDDLRNLASAMLREGREWHRQHGIIWSWYDGVSVNAMKVKDLDVLLHGRTSEARAARRSTDIDTWTAPDWSRVERGAKRATRRRRHRRQSLTQATKDALLWSAFMRSGARSAAEFARLLDEPARSIQHAMRAARQRIEATDPDLAALLPPLRVGRPNAQPARSIGAGIDGNGPTLRSISSLCSADIHRFRCPSCGHVKAMVRRRRATGDEAA